MRQISEINAEPQVVSVFLDAESPATLPFDSHEKEFVLTLGFEQHEAAILGSVPAAAGKRDFTTHRLCLQRVSVAPDGVNTQWAYVFAQREAKGTEGGDAGLDSFAKVLKFGSKFHDWHIVESLQRGRGAKLAVFASRDEFESLAAARGCTLGVLDGPISDRSCGSGEYRRHCGARSRPFKIRLRISQLRTGSIEYAGHTLLTSLRILDSRSNDAPLVGLWSLTQMPHQGELFIPTYSKTEPWIYFGLANTPADELTVSDRLVRFKMRAAGEHKIGLRAAVTTGRIGYIYPTGDQHALIVRNFFVNPSGEYADVPWTEPDNRGYSTQACSVNSRWGMFSEMEYHVPAIGGETGLRHIEDHSQLWAFRGSREDIVRIARVLVSNEIQ